MSTEQAPEVEEQSEAQTQPETERQPEAESRFETESEPVFPDDLSFASAIQLFRRWVRESMYLKLAMIAFVSLLLMIPLSLVSSLTQERNQRKKRVVSQIAAQWAKAQLIAGPVLNVPYREHVALKGGKSTTRIAIAHFLPSSLHIAGNITPQHRYRGIYRAVVYTAKLRIKGSFSHPSFRDWPIQSADILWNKAFLSFGLSDVRGIARAMVVDWAGKSVSLGPGIRSFDIASQGVSALVPLAQKGSYPFSLSLQLKGTGELQFLPLGKETKVNISSPWASPSFNGAFLPASRQISKKGFDASWQVFDMNRTFPQRWRKGAYKTNGVAFGVKLFQGNNSHQKAHRLQKYSLVFLGCIILLLFLVETLARERLHVVHYGLFGLALCIFYLLQLALSEHVGYNPAYLIAATLSTMLLSLYARWVCVGRGVPWLIAGIAATLHGLFFVMLQLEDYALLLGSGVSLVVLVVVMNLSARLKHKIGDEARDPEAGKTTVLERP